jgi:hypothetical protein
MNMVCQAQSLPLMTRHTREATLNGEAQLVGRLPAAETMRLVLVLPLRNQTELDNFLTEVYDPASPSYRQFLTVGEFTARFGPSPEDYDAVIQFAKTNGFTVVGTSPNRLNLDITGPVESVEQAFHLTMGVYNHPTENRTFYAPDREPTPDLRVQLWHIAGLDNFSIPQPTYSRRGPGVVSSATTGSGPSASFLASDMRAAYYGGAALTGTGQSLGLLEYYGTDLTDLNTYYANIGQANFVPITLLSTDGTSTSCVYPACDDTEQTLDMTQALGMAPDLSSLVMYVGSTDSAIFNAMATAVPLNAQLSSSWAWSPADPNTDNPYFEEFAAQGQNLFQATGDSGAWKSSSKIYPADDVYITAVGGTDLNTSSAAGAWSSETAWVDGGGGISPDKYAIPSWQTTAASHCSSCSKTYRNGPDVSANANFSFYVCADQTTCTANEYGGTSFAAPMWAGYLALVNEQAVANSGKPVGFINPTLYTIGSGSSYHTDFHDITSGSNGYSATTGYDLATGWGSPNGAGLINALAGVSTTPSFYLTVTPSLQRIATGSSGNYTVTVNPTNGFTGTVSLTVSGQPAGITATFNPASVVGSGSTTLTVSVPVGIAGGAFILTIAGTNGSIKQSIDVSVTVFTPATAVFAKYDTTTQGTWKGVYGSNGWAIAEDSTNYPAYATVALNGESNYVWASSTTDVRALESGATSGRIASTWYSYSSFTINVNLTDGKAHQVAMYAVDWDDLGCAETITLTDASSGTLLDTRSISGFSSGEWLVWNLTGNVLVTVTLNGNQNAVISGIFFDPAAALTPGFEVLATPSSQSTGRSSSVNYTVTVSPSGGFAGTVALSASGLPTGATASLNPTTITNSGTATLTVTTNSTIAGGSYPITVTGTSGSLTSTATVTLAVQVIIPASAVFAKYDLTTQGTWKGVYGSNGWAIADDSTNYPAYATVALNGESNYVWASSTTAVQALESGVTSGRVATTWYSSSSFTINVNLTDGNTHQVAMYAVDWGDLGRAETITLTDANSGALLDTRSISNFSNGEWLVWNLTGNVLVTVTLTGDQNAVISGIFFDPAAALTPGFEVLATPSSQSTGRSSSVNYTVTVSPSGGFAGTVALSASGLPTGATASLNPTSITNSGTATLTVTTNNTIAGGSYPITVSGVSGSLTSTATVTLAVQVVIPASAAFAKYDTTTQGTWKGVYGANGSAIAEDSTNYPAYATVAFNGEGNYVWASSTTDVRALESGVTSGRIASTWYSSGFTININLTDGNAHQVAMYALDWDDQGRAETITLTDANSGALLDTRSISNFSNGEWLVWNLTGKVLVTVTQTGNQNAVMSGIFFDPPGPLTPSFEILTTPSSETVGRSASVNYAVTVSAAGGFAGAVALSASGLPSGATASFNPASITGSGTSTLTVTTNNTVAAGSYPITVTGVSGSLTESATVTLAVQVVVPAAAAFLRYDTTTQGTWKGVYGGNGWAIADDSTNYPAYATVALNEESNYTWDSSTTDVRALESGVSSGRIASTWYSSSSFTININLTDGNTHQVEMYALDWDDLGRAETITLTDANSGAVLDTRNISGFSGGEWLVYNLTGNVLVTVTLTGNQNAVISGLFFQ